MRDGWTRATPVIEVDAAAAESLLAPAFPGARVAGIAPVSGGLANTNLKVTLAGHDAPLLLRLYQRAPAEARKEWALHRRLAGIAPVPAVLHAAESNPLTGGPYAVVEWVDGDHLGRIAPGLGRRARDELARDIGRVLAAIHEVTFPTSGFLDASLDVAHPIDAGAGGLLGFLKLCLVEGQGGERLGVDLTQAALAFAEREGHRLEAWTRPARLTHSDFNGSNVLVRETASGWRVAAVLDWEFAFAGAPFFDFGNLLRPPLGEIDGFAEAVAAGYREGGSPMPADWRALARIADLTAWADFLNRNDATPAVIADARRMIAATVRP
jgi:aminoglycoside phosphotransferase (APT) family kinase protein